MQNRSKYEALMENQWALSLGACRAVRIKSEESIDIMCFEIVCSFEARVDRQL